MATPLFWGERPAAETRVNVPVSLLYLASYANAHGLRAVIVDAASRGLDLSQTVAEVVGHRPRYVGCSAFEGADTRVRELLGEVKRSVPTVTTVVGGPLMTTAWDELIRDSRIDIGVIGEGEQTLLELLEMNRDSEVLVPGTVIHGANGLRRGDDRPPIVEMDNLPWLDYGLLGPPPSKALPTIYLSTSRGCVYRCTYCSTATLWPGRVRRMSVSRLIAEMRHHLDQGPVEGFGFLDDSFFADRRWLREFFGEVGSLETEYYCIGRADHLRRDCIEQLAATGCDYIAMGVETGSVDRQKALRKRLDLEAVRANVALLHEHGIFSKCFFMLGFPDETPEQMAQTINLAVELKTLGMNACTFYPVNLYRGTQLHREHVDVDAPSILYRSALHAVSSAAADDASGGEPVPDELGERMLRRYSTVPAAQVNAHLSPDAILELIRRAYHHVARGTPISVDSIEGLGRLRSGVG